jgi:hypothetical protein
MKRIGAYVALVGPILAWLPVHLWIRAQVHEWWVSRANLPRLTLILVWIDNGVVRWGPSVGLAAILAVPAIAYLVGRDRQASAESERRALLGFSFLAGATWLVPLLVLRVDFDLYAGIWTLLDLAGTLTFAIGLGSGYALQASRRSRTRKAEHPAWVLLVGFVALTHGQAAALSWPVLYWLWSAWRARSEAAEQIAGLPRPSLSEAPPPK